MKDVKKFKEEFGKFVREYNAIGIAVGIVMGNAVTKLVSSIVADIVMPFLCIIIPSGNWREAEIGLGNLHVKIGNFLGALLDFAIIAVVVFVFVKVFVKRILNDKDKKV
ncbi:MAG: MscL family protein [Candidatus Omnitrophota bacterium]|jgi:large conductance mechanosensitive channel